MKNAQYVFPLGLLLAGVLMYIKTQSEISPVRVESPPNLSKINAPQDAGLMVAASEKLSERNIESQLRVSDVDASKLSEEEVKKKLGLKGDLFIIRKDFDEALKFAPPLDSKDPRFEERRARFWHEEMSRQIVTLSTLTSSTFRDRLMEALDVRDPKTSIAMMEQISCGSDIEKFVKRFFVRSSENALKLDEIGRALQPVVTKLKLQDGPISSTMVFPEAVWRTYRTEELKKLVPTLRKYEREARLVIYEPTVLLDDIDRRKAFHLFIERIMVLAEAELKSRQ